MTYLIPVLIGALLSLAACNPGAPASSAGKTETTKNDTPTAPYALVSRAGQLRARIGDEGAQLRDLSGEATWSTELSLLRYGRSRAWIPAARAQGRAEGKRVELRRPGITEYYVEQRDGLEHGFVLDQRPAGSGELIVEVAVGGDLQPRAVVGSEDLELARDGRSLLRYADLKVWDARSRSLEARMAPAAHDGQRIIRIVVDDAKATYPVTIDPTLSAITSLTASDAVSDDAFGSAVSTDGQLAAIGAPDADDGGTDAGSVYLFQQDANGTWTQSTELTPPDASAGKRFGAAVALVGDRLVVGAPGDGNGSGAVYVFDRGSGDWSRVSKLLPGATSGAAGFGSQVDLSGDGLRAFASEPLAARGGSQRGAVHLFDYDEATDAWNISWTFDAPAAADDDLFGQSLAYDDASGELAIGAPGRGAGVAFVFRSETFGGTPPQTAWSVLDTLTPADGTAGDAYGSSLGFSSNRLAVGAPNQGVNGAVYVHARNTGGTDTFGLERKLSPGGQANADAFGESLSLFGSLLVVGAPADGGGAVYTYGYGEGGAGNWGLISQDSLSPPQGSSRYGAAVDVDTVILAAAPDRNGGGQVEVFGAEHPPLATNDSYETNGIGAISIGAPGLLRNDRDPNGDAMQAVVATGPANGTLSLTTTGAFTYTPDSGFVGADTFTYTAGDGAETSIPATVTITVPSPNQPPVAANDNATSLGGAPVTIDVLANDSDPENDPLELYSVSPPSHGTTQKSNGKVIYTPTSGYVGSDSFTYLVRATGGFDTGTVTVDVESAGPLPTAVDDLFTTNEDTPLGLTPLDNDSDSQGEALSLLAVSDPPNGSATINGDTIDYAPDANWAGLDAFTYTIRNTSGATATATIRVSVNEVPDPPEAVDDQASTLEDVAVTIDVLANDSDAEGSALTIVTVSDPPRGSAVISGNQIVYTPGTDLYGEDTFTYTIRDATNRFATATVTVTVIEVNETPRWIAPTPVNEQIIDAGATLAFRLVASDDDPGDTIVYGATGLPSGSSLNSANGQFLWTTSVNDRGAYSPSFTATDGEATITRTIPILVRFVDEDNDGIADDWERRFGLDPSTPDSDGDTIVDLDEVGSLDSPSNVDGQQPIDALDIDSDNDGILDIDEAGDADLATEPVDTDGDGVADFRDTDSDDDGVEDGTDNCRLIANAGQSDVDGDGAGDDCDDDADDDLLLTADELALSLDPLNPDTDGDTIADGDEVVRLPEASNVDGDELIDALDLDSDDDGITDADEAGDADLTTSPVDTDGDGVADFRDTDSDDDGVEDSTDNCRLVANADQADADGDGIGDACQAAGALDSDGDGVEDDDDNCPGISNPDQADLDADGVGDACDSDRDGDGVADNRDNCPDAANADQADEDADGTGDACDDAPPVEADADEDGVADGDDNCPETANADQADKDGDGVGDACEDTTAPPNPVIPRDRPADDGGCCRVLPAQPQPSPIFLLGLFLAGVFVLRRRR